MIADVFKSVNFSKINDGFYFVCPYCGMKTLKSEAKIVEQKDKLLSKETKYQRGPLGKGFFVTTETYSVYKIRQCPNCAEKVRKQIIRIYIICSLVIPAILGLIHMSFVSFGIAVFLGIILSAIIVGQCVERKVDIEKALKDNAVVTLDDELFNMWKS